MATSDSEEKQLLQSREATVSAAEDSSCNWAVILGTLLAIGALVSLFVVIFSAFVTLWLWPILGALLLVGHGLLLFAVADSQTRLATPAKLSAAALFLEVLCYVFLVPTYLFRSFIVPWWWWNASVILFVLPSLILLWVTICQSLCGTTVEKCSAGGLMVISLVILLVGVLLLVAGNFSPSLMPPPSVDLSSSLLPGRFVEEIQTIRNHVQMASGELDATVGYEICDMATSECSMKKFVGWTVVKPGGATACLDGDFKFVVYPGDPGRLLFHLHGGGACWNWMTFLLGKCTKKSPMKPTGIFNVTNPDNPFYNWTLVDVPYCSGDVFGGATENFWIMAHQTASAWKSQAGYANVNSVLDWVKVQFAGAVPALRTLSKFVVAGESAGSLGVQIWATNLLRRLESHYEPENTILIGDSFVGAIPGDTDLFQRQVMEFWGVCQSGVVPEELKPECTPDRLVMTDFPETTMQLFPSVRYMMIGSKFDQVQMAFGDFVIVFDYLWTLLWKGIDSIPLFSNATFYEQLSGDLLVYSAYKQFSAYLVDAKQHTYTIWPLYFIRSTTPAGPFDDCSSPYVGERLLEWLSPHSEEKASYQCYNTEEDAPNWTAHYCDHMLPWQVGRCEPSN